MTNEGGGYSPRFRDKPENFRGGTVVDFSHVPTRQDAIHLRLEHWAMWVRVRPQPWKVQPMFKQYRSHAWQWERPEIQVQLNTLEATETERAVSWLPEPHRTVVRWAYVFPHIPVNAVRSQLGLTREMLARVLVDGRDMMRNRLSEKLPVVDIAE